MSNHQLPALWAVFRVLPDEPPSLRSASPSLPEAERAHELEEYRVRDLEGYEDCKHVLVEYEAKKHFLRASQ